MAKQKPKDPALEKAIQEAGGPATVAKFISEHFGKISPQAVCKWTKCPPRRALQLEAAVKAKRGKTRARQLCPDVFISA